MVKFIKDDYIKWTAFNKSNINITKSEFKLLCQLHSKYFKHQLHYPCSCAVDTIKKWMNQLNKIYDNGY